MEAAISIRSPDKQLSPPIIVLDGVAVGYEPNKPVLRGLDLRIDDDDRIALLGPNGNGKSTFAKLLAERLKPERGRPKVRSRVAEIGFSGEAADTKVASLSGGEKARLLMGLASFHGPHLLILDEPTNHLDIEAREALIEAVNDYEGAVLLVTHDRHLLDACAERLWLVANGTVRPFDGDIDQYRRDVLGRSGAQRMRGRAVPIEKHAEAKRSELAPLRKRIAALETAIEKLEQEIAGLDRKLVDPAQLNGHLEAARLGKRRADAATALAEAEEEWLAASARREELSA
jgi:ATP-binding cassette subfamily F protein 3